MKKASLRFFSPAKLNLFFQVLHKRKDGYHEIASIYQAVDLGDFLVFTASSSLQITTTSPTIPTGENNLAYRAVELFRKHHPATPYFHIHIEKNIPQEAGLGGASSNAATTLWALNRWMDRPFSTEELQKMAVHLGADVPFFFSSGFAYCTGIGEKVVSLKATCGSKLDFVADLYKPKSSLSTPKVYGEMHRFTCSKTPFSPQDFLAKPVYTNDLEKAACFLAPDLIEYKKRLFLKGYKTVSMSGSGTCYFCLGKGDTSTFPKPLQTVFGITRKKNQWYSQNS